MSARRPLTFSSLDEVMPEVDRLLAGHATVGKWTLGQICNHLSLNVRSSVEGFGASAPWIIRATVGPVIKKIIFRTGQIKEGIETPEDLVPKPDLDSRAEAETLRASIAYYLTHPTPRVTHPFFGRLTPKEWDRLHCIHCAHHLSFALPA
jgi:hypothetical protein